MTDKDCLIGETAQEWTDDDGYVWMVATRWAEIDGRAECVGLTLRSFGVFGDRLQPLRRGQEIRPITAVALRGLNVRPIFAEARSTMLEITSRAADIDLMPPPDESDRRASQALAAPGRPAGGPRSLDGTQLALVATAYLRAQELGQAVGPAVQDACADAGDPVGISGAYDRIKAARRAGLLPATTRGRPRGGAGN